MLRHSKRISPVSMSSSWTTPCHARPSSKPPTAVRSRGTELIDRDQCGVLRTDEELVVIPVVAVARMQPDDLAVGAVEDHVLARRFPSGKHGPTPVGLHPEVHRTPVRPPKGTEPHHLPAIVEDHRAALAGAALFRGDEDVAGSCVVRPGGDLDGGRAKVGARAEGPRALHRRGRSVWQGLESEL